MKNIIKRGLWLSLLALTLMLGIPLSAKAADIGSVNVTVNYGQTEARSMLAMINRFRTGNQAWFWNSDGRTKTVYQAGTLHELTYDYDLEKIAMQRAAELAVVFSHMRPNGTLCTELMYDGIHTWGENIAYGWNMMGSAAQAFEAWQETDEPYEKQGHRRNMLDEDFTSIGIGFAYFDGYYFWTQEFGYTNSGAAYTEPANYRTTVKVDCLPEYQGSWEHDSRGWRWREWSGYPRNAWREIGGDWYWFRSDGYMVTGWQRIGGVWYYFDPGGPMQTGWKKISGTWYYLKLSGAMATGWQFVDGKWYYLSGDGAMQTGWKKIGGTWYYLNGDGTMATGWKKLGKTWYYLKSSGAMATGWQLVDGKWYYLTGDGAMQTGWKKIGGVWYYLNGDGSMATGWLQIGKARYYLNPSGEMAVGWKFIDPDWYYFSDSGEMKSNCREGQYWLREDGTMATNEVVGGYYAAADGTLGPWREPVKTYTYTRPAYVLPEGAKEEDILSSSTAMADYSKYYSAFDEITVASDVIVYGEVERIQGGARMHGMVESYLDVRILQSLKGPYQEGDIIKLFDWQGFCPMDVYIASYDTEEMRNYLREEYSEFSDEELKHKYHYSTFLFDLMEQPGEKFIYFLQKTSSFDTDHLYCAINGGTGKYLELLDDKFVCGHDNLEIADGMPLADYTEGVVGNTLTCYPREYIVSEVNKYK